MDSIFDSRLDDACDAFKKALDSLPAERKRGNVIERKGSTLYTVRRSELDELREFDRAIEGR